MNLKALIGFMSPEKLRAQREREYLNGSISIYDLERRQKEIERGSFR